MGPVYLHLFNDHVFFVDQFLGDLVEIYASFENPKLNIGDDKFVLKLMYQKLHRIHL